MDIVVWAFAYVFFLSPLWLSIVFVIKWSKFLKRRLRFLIISIVIMFFLLIISFLVFNLLIGLGVDYWYLSGRVCETKFICRAFDFLYDARGGVPLLIYLFLTVSWLMFAKRKAPEWFGFSSNNQ